MPLRNAGPYLQKMTRRRLGCQIDLLIRTRKSVYVVEIKLREKITRSIIGEVQQKVERLRLPRSLSVRTALVYEGDLHPAVAEDDYFDAVVPFGDLLVS